MISEERENPINNNKLMQSILKQRRIIHKRLIDVKADKEWKEKE